MGRWAGLDESKLIDILSLINRYMPLPIGYTLSNTIHKNRFKSYNYVATISNNDIIKLHNYSDDTLNSYKRDIENLELLKDSIINQNDLGNTIVRYSDNKRYYSLSNGVQEWEEIEEIPSTIEKNSINNGLKSINVGKKNILPVKITSIISNFKNDTENHYVLKVWRKTSDEKYILMGSSKNKLEPGFDGVIKFIFDKLYYSYSSTSDVIFTIENEIFKNDYNFLDYHQELAFLENSVFIAETHKIIDITSDGYIIYK